MNGKKYELVMSKNNEKQIQTASDTFLCVNCMLANSLFGNTLPDLGAQSKLLF